MYRLVKASGRAAGLHMVDCLLLCAVILPRKLTVNNCCSVSEDFRKFDFPALNARLALSTIKLLTFANRVTGSWKKVSLQIATLGHANFTIV